MNLLSTLPFSRFKTKIPQQVQSSKWSDREAILKPGINLFCWQRPIEEHIQRYLDCLAKKDLENIRIHIGLTDLEYDLRKARGLWDETSNDGSDAFWNDVSLLTRTFLNMSTAGAGTLHLKSIANDACTKFHLDGHNLRLFTTYYGPGTEWLPEKAVNRSALGKRNDQILKDPKMIRRMQPFEVGILKGEIPNRSGNTPGIVHRSPPIHGSGKKRIIMRIDI